MVDVGRVGAASQALAEQQRQQQLLQQQQQKRVLELERQRQLAEAAKIQQQQQQQQWSRQNQENLTNIQGMKKINVVVPPDYVPGKQLRIMFEGLSYDIKVPDNCRPGTKFAALLPVDLAKQQQAARESMRLEHEQLEAERARMQSMREKIAAEEREALIQESLQREEEARIVFTKYDRDFNAAIDKTELEQLLRDQGFPPEVLEREIQMADQDLDAFISFDEFVVYYNHLMQRIAHGAVDQANAEVQAQKTAQERLNAATAEAQANLKRQEAALALKEAELLAREAQISQSIISQRTAQQDAATIEGRVTELVEGNARAAAMLQDSVARDQAAKQAKLRARLEARRSAQHRTSAPTKADMRVSRQLSISGSMVLKGGEPVMAIN